MNMTPEQLEELKNEVIDRLEDFISQITRGVAGVGIDLTKVDQYDLLSEATAALASGDLLRCIVMDTIDNMDTNYGEKDSA